MLAAEKINAGKLYFFACAAAFTVIILRAFFIPFSHDEAATFFFYVQNGDYLPYKSYLYTNNHVLNSALANLCYEIAGSHRFVLRLPNIVSFCIMALAVFRFLKYLNSNAAKLTLVFLLILNIHFLDFFELCRGYGISMAFMTLGLSFLSDYFLKKRFRSFILLSVSLQLALAANLTLIVPFAFIFATLFFFQLNEKLFLSFKNIILWIFNLALLLFWLKFTWHLKSQGMLDSGAPHNYWRTTFQSLIFLISGTESAGMQLAFVLLFVFTVTVHVFHLVKHKRFSMAATQFFYPLMLLLLIISFYILNKIASVNFPEDRTVLFMYVIFALALCFAIDQSVPILKNLIGLLAALFAILNMILFFNLGSFGHYFYHVLPKDFYSQLEKEFNSKQQIFTIGGNPAREMVFTFSNYRGNSVLNPMDEPREMHMNCDYYVASKTEEPYYRHFYHEILQDKTWNRVLLKRKEEIKRKAILHAPAFHYSGTNEFVEFLKLKDSVFPGRNCIDADVVLTFNQVPAPLHAWLVLQASNENDSTIFYKRIPLNWLGDDLNGKTKRLRLTSPPLPRRFKNFAVYIWNIDKQNISVSLTELTLFHLEAKGINFVIPESYYKMSSQITDKVIL